MTVVGSERVKPSKFLGLGDQEFEETTFYLLMLRVSDSCVRS